MVKKIKTFMEEHHMVMPGERVLAGVSGGADSVCLCLVLAELSKEMDFTLEVIHVEHGIRGAESRRDASFVQKLCARLGIMFHEKDVDVPFYANEHHLGEEEAARILRYEAYAEYAGAGTKTAVAHHMDDNAETVLFQMIRGSGLNGLCGIPPVRRDSAGNTFIRPLLCVGRKEIEEFLKVRGQAFCTDSTNSRLCYSRNRLRQNVMPELALINPQALCHISQTAGRLAELKDYMDQELLREYGHVVKKEPHSGKVRILIQAFRKLPGVLQTGVLHKALADAAGAAKDISSVHIRGLRELMEKQTGAGLDLPHGVAAKRVYGELELEIPKEEQKKPVCQTEISREQLKKLEESAGKQMRILAAGESFLLETFPFDGNFGKIPQKMYTKWFDYDMIKNGIFIRNRRPGDYFLLDQKGHHKKLKDYLTGEKIPAKERDSLLLLANESQIFWIMGRRMGYGAEITENTRTVLAVTWTREESGDELQ